jgi:hypothetical protein
VASFHLIWRSLVAGSWLGSALYGTPDEGAFREIVLVLLLASGAALVASVP